MVLDCTLMFNNYRRFHSGWHAGGMKCIPGNVRCTIRSCEAAYNITSDGIWFDCDNADIRILGNISHHNDGAGIFYEINKGGGIIADNLVVANRSRGMNCLAPRPDEVRAVLPAASQVGCRRTEWPPSGR